MGKLPVLLLLVGALAACSVKRTAVDIVGNAISGGGDAYASDDDPELIREAMPFGLKTYESLLEVSPGHEALLLSAARGFTAYAYLLQEEADRLDAADLERARTRRDRARKHYLRGRDYALRGLAVAHPGFAAALRQDAAAALAATDVADVPFLYWGGIAWAGALSAAKNDLDLLAELPLAAAMVGRVIELDETYESGAAHEFFIAYEGGRPGGSADRAREHYARALELSGGARASVHLALAEAVAIKQQDLAEFRDLIGAALAIDPDRRPELRLVNTIAQQRARWLESRIPDLFVEASDEEGVI
ncbi:MAG: TRAP transporter TatT component family protein [Alphaproteobacteria bacterium]